MTGMGKDGAENIGMISRKGGVTIAQNQQTSIVFGMPKVAIEKGNINFIEPLGKIPEIITKIVTTRSV
jgi:two-component system chemotaxis response regulator CheB